MSVTKEIEKIYEDIRLIRVQGATNIAKAGLKAYFLSHNEDNKRKILGLRPTEPTLSNALNFADIIGRKKAIMHFKEAQKKINSNVFKLINKNTIIYTHCHSTNVINALIFAKKNGRKFEVFNTETRPLYQGRKTAKELAKNKIKVTSFVDSAFKEAIEKSDIILLGADAILKKGVVNKIGSGTIAELARLHKKPLYIVADSWKFSPKNVKLEQRHFEEVWKNVPKRIKIMNPAFETVKKELVKKIISEYGVLEYDSFVKIAENMPKP